MTSTRPGLRTLTFSGELHEADRVTLRDQLGAVFCDESATRPGWGWLCPDRRLTVCDDGPQRWKLHIWEVDDVGTTDEWVDAQVVSAFANTDLELLDGPAPPG